MSRGHVLCDLDELLVSLAKQKLRPRCQATSSHPFVHPTATPRNLKDTPQVHILFPRAVGTHNYSVRQ